MDSDGDWKSAKSSSSSKRFCVSTVEFEKAGEAAKEGGGGRRGAATVTVAGLAFIMGVTVLFRGMLSTVKGEDEREPLLLAPTAGSVLFPTAFG